MTKIIAGLAVFTSLTMTPAFAARMHQAPPPDGQVMSREPGRLAFGQSVLVDDRSCPAGQIKKITGGNSKVNIPRTKECVAR